MNVTNLGASTNQQLPPHHPSEETMLLANSFTKTWYLSQSQLTHLHALVPCSNPSLHPLTPPLKNPGLPPTASKSSIARMLTLCTNEPLTRPTHSVSSPRQTSSGNNRNHQHATPSMDTHTLHLHQASTHFNSLDLQFRKDLAHYWSIPENIKT